MHGLTEATVENLEEAGQEDSDRIIHLLHELDCDDISIDAFVRLGRKPTADDAKPRPIKLIVSSEQQKDRILARTKNLRNSKDTALRKVFVHQDLTPRQRQKRMELVRELKERQAKGEPNLMIINGKIVLRKVQMGTDAMPAN